MLSKKDLKVLKTRETPLEKFETQMHNFETGFPYLKIVAPATLGRGIDRLPEIELNICHQAYISYSGNIGKFVPASGAASRMFKDLYEAIEILNSGEKLTKGSNADIFLANMDKFPFFDDLTKLKLILGEDGLALGSKPKGIIPFHKYNEGVRTPFEEHLVEGAYYAKDKQGRVNIHFTVSPEHLDKFKELMKRVKDKYQERYNCKYKISFSIQSPSTDVIAADNDNNPFRDEKGNLLFRPGGHGALIKNLNESGQDLIFIKNIDNVQREEYLADDIYWKKILAGKLLIVKDKVFGYLKKLDKIAKENTVNQERSDSLYSEIIDFMQKEFSVKLPTVPKAILHEYLYEKLNRPIRICGMIKNEGEPGGGPYIVYDADGSTSLQILESAQLNLIDPVTKSLFNTSTHFNPVDLVVWLKNYKGEKFDLNRFVDPQTGFISSKSYNGRELKAQELPGLWNGAMSNWSTIFIETPSLTFNPVKTVLDLLRKEHLG